MFRFCRPALIGVMIAAGSLGSAHADNNDVAAGAAEYKTSCFQCHGESGKGDGPMAQFLTIKPADLTLLAKKNNGTFPFREVFQSIDGRAGIKAHGVGPMPIWGDRYTAQSGGDLIEPYKTWTSEPVVRARILELTYYLQSIQQ